MSIRLSRTQIARHVAKQLQAGSSDIIKQLAAYLVVEKRVGELDLLLRSIYDELERDGVVVADIVSAQGIAAEVKDKVKQLLGAKQLVLNEQTDPAVLGGVRISTPSRLLDATVRHRLTKLHERKV